MPKGDWAAGGGPCMLALRVPASLAPVTLAFELARGGGARVRARDGGAFAVPIGMAAGDPSVLGALPVPLPAPSSACLRWSGLPSCARCQCSPERLYSCHGCDR